VRRGTTTAVNLVGRGAEVSAVEALLTLLPSGGGALVVRGEAGMGKSVLLDLAVRRAVARGVRVLSCIGVQSETDLPFAGLHQLLAPVLGAMATLPDSRRDAIRAALRLDDVTLPDRFQISLAAFDLLVNTAEDGPLLLVADDVQWLDRPTGEVLAFVARRLGPDPVVLLAACRDGEGEGPLDAVGLPDLLLGPLAPVDAEALLEKNAVDVPGEIRERILGDAAGNPLALVELPGIAARFVGDGLDLPQHLPLSRRLERTFTTRAAHLPAKCRTLLLVAAMNADGSVHESLTAASQVIGAAVTLTDVSPAVDARLVDVTNGRLRFRHPLVRSGLVQAASPADRQAAHAALADVLTQQPERRVWHLAAAAAGPDESIAIALEDAALLAERRGAPSAAITALVRAADLSEAPGRRGDRLVRAGLLAHQLGSFDSAVRLLDAAVPLPLDESVRTRLNWWREVLVGGFWTGADRIRTFADLADRMLDEGHVDLAVEALVDTALRCYWSNPDAETRSRLLAVVDRIPLESVGPDAVEAMALIAPVERRAVVLEALARVQPYAGDLDAMLHYGNAALAVGEAPLASSLLSAAVAGFRTRGHLGKAAQGLVYQAWASVLLGTPSIADPVANEAERLAVETGQMLWAAVAQLAQAVLAGRHGDTTRAEGLANAAEAFLLPLRANPLLSQVAFARGTAALGAGRPEAAYDHLAAIFDPLTAFYHPHVRSWALIDLVEAAVRCDRREQGAVVVAEMAPQARGTGASILGVAVAVATAMLAADDGMDDAVAAAMDLDLSQWPLARARLLLAHGVQLRRRRETTASRVSLRAARDTFDALGAVPWGEQARQELRASGEVSARRTPRVTNELTPQEFQIAQLAAAGLTNREIAQQLYLSHRTISTHLYRIYPKLGVTSRRELEGALPGQLPTRRPV
jgi:DNA-binding CsgD family transcriptional regulator